MPDASTTVINNALGSDSPVIVEVSDIGLRASHAGAEFYNEPGIALLAVDRDRPILGHPAQRSLRQQPTRIHSRYWSELGTDALQINNTNIRHSADLVWHQISQIKSRFEDIYGSKEVCFCTPANMNRQQMQLLTGICQSLDFQVRSIVNLGLAQIAGCEDGNISHYTEITHIDLQLHQLVVSTYASHTKNGLELKEQETIQDIGFLRLIDHLLHILRDKFIQNSRFDPLHSGDTEQQLFDQLMRLVETGEHVPFQIDSPQKQHGIELGIQELEGHIANFKAELTSRLPASGPRAYAPVFSLLPGFKCATSELRLTISDAARGASLLLAQQQESDGITYISQAQIGHPGSGATGEVTAPGSGPISVSALDNEPTAANALLFNHQVYTENSLANLAISGVPNNLFGFNEYLVIATSSQVTVNDSPPSINQQLYTGDRVKVGHHELLAVRIADSSMQ